MEDADKKLICSVRFMENSQLGRAGKKARTPMALHQKLSTLRNSSSFVFAALKKDTFGMCSVISSIRLLHV